MSLNTTAHQNQAEDQHISSPSSSASAPTPAPAIPPTSLSLFFLPPELVSTLVLKTQTEDQAIDPSELNPIPIHTRESKTAAVVTSLDNAVPSCRVCGIAQFESVQKQREHAKLDWHRYNLKQQLLDKRAKPITEHQFENMMQDLSSISGSDSEDSTSEDDSSSHKDNVEHTGEADQEALVKSLMKKLELTVKQSQKTRQQDPMLVHQQRTLEQQLLEARMSPMIWFTSPLYDETVRLGIYKNALPSKGQSDNIVEYLKSLQFPVAPVIKKQKNNKARREARRAAAAGTAAVESTPESSEQPGTDSSLQEPIINPSEPVLTKDEDRDASKETLLDQEADEEEEEEEHEPDWIKYERAKHLHQTTPMKPANQARYWTLIMIGGGHFAGVVVDLAGQLSSHGRELKLVAHKTFHRYTVRRKQGGSQGTHGIANSAGARIRMYNEEALKLEVRELLDGWSHWIKQSECVFVHSPGNNRRVLFYENSVISAAERQGRLRSIPFMTRRPTLSELKRAYQELTTVKVSVLTKNALRRKEAAEQEALERALSASHAKSAKDQDGLGDIQKEPVVPDLSPELAKLIELVKKGRAEAMSSQLLKHGIDVSQLLPLTTSTEYDIRRTPTILHLASHHGQAQVVKLLLEKHLADPTTTSASTLSNQLEAGEEESSALGAGSFTAYDIAKDKETRNAFRRAMALLPEAWDWIGGAHVPSALTPEMEAEQERKAKEKTRKLLEAERDRKKTREASRPTAPVGQNLTKTSSPASSSVMTKNMASISAANTHLSPEMRMRLERERRATAAEARMAVQRQAETTRRAVQEGKNVCVACGKSLDNLTPFDKFGRKFCTTECVAKGPA
ncbi:hypothetical protein BC939DRAFT_137127 [Gamsiella multidivaricata]|uniref:uncharacterized protein n=1 Tax=Gamsiella multidivaricata TaxID=101098 RepID=UPI0022204971|nr:uncharacterized protein BC939DRAFT_137127 [Gamsiella multidivaricata]KAG0365488.1 hypothetical protein BGZ54_006477 [Gamsiella multidivaricata]KAI7824607.1 hypothetical protein BC939DRAFT_137127 [Gamsiella multidivaricata]